MELYFTELTQSYVNNIWLSPAYEVDPSIYFRMHNLYFCPFLKFCCFLNEQEKRNHFDRGCFFSSLYFFFEVEIRYLTSVRGFHLQGAPGWSVGPTKKEQTLKFWAEFHGKLCILLLFFSVLLLLKDLATIFFLLPSLSIPVVSLTPPLIVNT